MKKLTIINPATEEVITDVTQDDQASVKKKFKELTSAQDGWQELLLSDRVNLLRQFATLLEKNTEQLSSILTSEVGKPLQQSRNEIKGAISRIKWLTDNAERYLTDEQMRNENGMEERISYEPLGVICNISAWNYPYLVGVNVFVPALLAGNTVMYKPSEYATLSGIEIESLLKQAGVPSTVFHIAVGGKETGELLLDLPFDGYFFTGSYKTGKYIYERVSSKMVPCQCELGGKDPLYVADDVEDIAKVAAATADGAFYNNGQSCCAVERIYVHEKVYDNYVDEFLKEVKTWKIGLPTQEGVYIGPLTRKDQLKVLEGQVTDAVNKGAIVLSGGKSINGQARPPARAGTDGDDPVGRGYYFEPTVLINVNHDMAVMKDESFGPIIGIMKVKDEDEAIRLMQDTEYGLTAAVYSSDKNKAEKILKKINAGTGYWNCCDRVSAALPWSGRKHSGFGTTLSHAGLRAFVKPKAYHFKS